MLQRMVAQAARELREVSPAGPGRLRVRLLLVCGCEIKRELAEDRVLARADGSRFAVGKYPCPLGHPAGPAPR